MKSLVQVTSWRHGTPQSNVLVQQLLDGAQMLSGPLCGASRQFSSHGFLPLDIQFTSLKRNFGFTPPYLSSSLLLCLQFAFCTPLDHPRWRVWYSKLLLLK